MRVYIMSMVRIRCKCFQCGKTFEWKAERWDFGDAKEWERWAMEKVVCCPDCEREAYEELRKKGINIFYSKPYAYKSTVLHGTKKQVEQAEMIRQNLLLDAGRFLFANQTRAYELRDFVIQSNVMRVLDDLRDVLVRAQNERSAAWWIKHNCSDGPHLLWRCYWEQRPKKLMIISA